MSQGRDIRSGGGWFELTTRDRGFYSGLKKSLGAAAKWSGQVSKLSAASASSFGLAGIGVSGGLDAIRAAFSGLSIAGFTKAFADAGSELDDFAQRTGFAARELSALAFVGSQNDFGLADIGTAAKSMANFLQNVAEDSPAASDALRVLGIRRDALFKASQFQRFREFVSALGNIPDPAQRSALAMQVFGRAAISLLPLINAGDAAFDRLIEKATELGVVMSDEDVAAAAALGDELDTLGQQTKGVTNKIGAALTPGVRRLTGLVSGLLTPIGSWIDRNREIIGTLVPIATTGLAVSAAVAAIAGGFAILGPYVPIAAAIAVGVGAIGVGARVLYRNLGDVRAAAESVFRRLVGLGQAGEAIAGNLSGYFRRAGNSIIGGFNLVGQAGRDAWSSITNAIAAGDLQAAFNVVLAAIDVGWDATIGVLQVGWNELTTEMALAGVEAAGMFQIAWANAWAAIKSMGIDVASQLKQTWIETQSRAALAGGFLQTQLRRAAYGTEIALAGLAEKTKIARPGTQQEVAAKRFADDAAATAAERKSRGDYQAGLIDAKAQAERDRKKSLRDISIAKESQTADIRNNVDTERGIRKEQREKFAADKASNLAKAQEAYQQALEKARNAKPGTPLSIPGADGGDSGSNKIDFEFLRDPVDKSSQAKGTFSAFQAAQGFSERYDVEQTALLGRIHDVLRQIERKNLGLL